MSLTPLPPLPLPPPLLEKYIFVALPSMNGLLPAELKFRENTVDSRVFLSYYFSFDIHTLNNISKVPFQVKVPIIVHI